LHQRLRGIQVSAGWFVGADGAGVATTGAEGGSAMGASGTTAAVAASSCSLFGVCAPFSRTPVAQPTSTTTSKGKIQALQCNPRRGVPPPHETWEHPTSNIQRPTFIDCANGGHWVFDVGCWMLDVLLLRLSGQMRVKDSGRSLPSLARPGTQADAVPGSNTRELCE
jgi:hypothetical protein